MPPACIANTVYGTLSNSVATISCTGSGTVIVSQNMKTPANTDSPFPEMQGPNPERKNTMAFLGRQSATLAPVLFCIGENNGDPNESHLFMLPCEPAARIDKLQSSITSLINGTIRGVVAVEPCQSFGLIYGAHDIIVVELTDKLNVVRTLQCDFEIEDVTASTWSTSQNEDDLHLTIVAVGCESSKQVSATTFSARDSNTNNKQRLESIENLEIPDTFDEEDEQQQQQQQEKDLIVSQTLQSANKNSPGAFIWWACWSNGLVTACFIESHAEENSVAAISLLQGIPELKQERYVAATLNICASHSTNNIAIWSTLNDAVTMVSTGTTFKGDNGDDQQQQQQQQPVAFHRSSEVLSVATPALATRAIRGGAFMMMVGLFPNDQIPWTHLVPLYNQLSAHNIIQPSTTDIATAQTGGAGGALQLARALLSVDNSQLNETVNQIEVILDSVEQKINGQSDHDLQTLDALEKQLNQLRICRTSLVRRVEVERVASRSATAPLGRAREWDRRLHSAFVLLHICRFFVSSKNSSSSISNSNKSTSSHHQALHTRRSTNSQSFLKAVEEELKIPQDLDEYSQWIQALWPARLAIEHACEEVGIFTCTELFNNPMKQFQKMVETSLDSVDGSLEWLAFFALYFFGSSSSSSNSCEATNTFVNALKLPPSVVSLARMARVIDNGNENNASSSSDAHDEIIITVEEASRLANDTSCIPVRVLMNTLFCGLCDEGALTAAYSMTSTMTVTSLIRGDNKNAFAREVALRLAFLSSQKRNTSILSILLDHVLATPHSARNFDDRALIIYVISAAVSVAARDETLFLFEGKLTDTFDQNFTLAQLSAFGAEKLKVELLVQLQRHSEALDAAQKYQSSNQAEQHWIGVVTSHLRSIVPHEDVKKTGNSSSSLMMFAAVGDDDAAKLSISSSANRGGVKSNDNNDAGRNNNAVALDADVVRPVPAAFYLSHHVSGSGSKNRNSNHQRCKVYMKKTGTECGCQVPCPYHSASSQHAVAMN